MEQFNQIKEFSQKQAQSFLNYIMQRRWAQASVAFLGLWALYAIFKHKGWLPKKSVKNKHVFVTGAGSGLGRRISEIFAEKGALISVSDINIQGANDTVRSIQSKGGKAVAIRCDVSDPEDVRRAAAEAVHQFGDVHILVNNAGIVSGKTILENSEKMIKKTLEVNTLAHAYTVRAFLPAMLAKNQGHIVTIASAAGLIGASGLADYCASKFGAVGFDESIRMELKKRGSAVKTTCICPFYINTGMFDGVQTRFSFILPILEEKWVSQRIVNAVLQNEEFLCTPQAVYLAVLSRGLFPTWLNDKIAFMMGVNATMDNFKGRSRL